MPQHCAPGSVEVERRSAPATIMTIAMMAAAAIAYSALDMSRNKPLNVFIATAPNNSSTDDRGILMDRYLLPDSPMAPASGHEKFVIRGAVALPGSKAISRTKGSS